MPYSVCIQLFPQPPDMHGKGVVIHIFTMLIPETIQNLFPGHHSAAVDLQVLYQLAFRGGEGIRQRRIALGTTDLHPNPGNQLPEPEGLCNVIIRPKLQPMYNVCLVITGGKEHHRAVLFLADPFAKS